MAEFRHIARPYVAALFELAKDDDALSAWSRVLSVLAQVVKDDQVSGLIDNPAFTQDAWTQLLLSIVSQLLEKETQQLGPLLSNFIKTMVQANRLSILPDMEYELQEQINRKAGIVACTVVVAQPLDDDAKESIQGLLRKKLNADVQLTFTQDEALIGGFVVKPVHWDWVMDASIRGKLNRLKETLRVT